MDNYKLIMVIENNPANPLIMKIMVQTMFTHLQKMGFVWK